MPAFTTKHIRLPELPHFVYAKDSRRAAGLSVGVDLTPDGACTFHCVYCKVDRSNDARAPRPGAQNVAEAVAGLLVHLAVQGSRPVDIAFAGSGEPLSATAFADALRAVLDVRDRGPFPTIPVRILTSGVGLQRPDLRALLVETESRGVDVWLKLDAGSASDFARVNAPNLAFQDWLEGVRALGRARRVTLQAMLFETPGRARVDIDAWLARVAALCDEGVRVEQVQIVTLSDPSHAETDARAIATAELEAIAARLRSLTGLRVDVYV